MQDLIPKIPGGYRSTPPPLNNIFPKPPPVPPPPEKYYAATAICKPTSNGGVLIGNGGTNNNNNNSTTTPTTPNQTLINPYSDVDAISNDDDLQLLEFPRHSLVIVEKLGSGTFGELHLCETKGLW